MTTSPPRGGRELSRIALQVATEASRLVLGGFRQRPTVSFKAGQEPVTQYDLQSEELIRQRLAELTPDIPWSAKNKAGKPAPISPGIAIPSTAPSISCAGTRFSV